MRSYYTHLIVLGGIHDGQQFPRTSEGLVDACESARRGNADKVRPFRPRSAGIDRRDITTEGLDDLEEYDGLIDWGNTAAFAPAVAVD